MVLYYHVVVLTLRISIKISHSLYKSQPVNTKIIPH